MGYPKRSKGRRVGGVADELSREPSINYGSRKFVLKEAGTGDPAQQEIGSAGVDEANDRRAVRQAIMTQLLREVADEIIGSRQKLGGPLEAYFKKGELKRLHGLIFDTEAQFNGVRDRLKVGRDFGSINLIIFANAMALGDINNPDRDVDAEEVARRVVIRAGLSGYQRTRKDGEDDQAFRGCK